MEELDKNKDGTVSRMAQVRHAWLGNETPCIAGRSASGRYFDPGGLVLPGELTWEGGRGPGDGARGRGSAP